MERVQSPIRLFLEKKVENFENNSVVNKLFLKDKTSNPADVFTGMTSMNGIPTCRRGWGHIRKTKCKKGIDRL